MSSRDLFDLSWTRCWTGLQPNGDGAALRQSLEAAARENLASSLRAAKA